MIIDSINADLDNAITPDSAEQELIRFMTVWGNLSGSRDTAALDKMLPDDLIQTMHDGRVLTKAKYLEGLITFPEDFRITDYDQQAQIVDSTAIVRAAYKVEMGGNAMHLRYTATFIKRGGKWQPVALHSSPLAK